MRLKKQMSIQLITTQPNQMATLWYMKVMLGLVHRIKAFLYFPHAGPVFEIHLKGRLVACLS
jgi:hypothetical protein